MSSQAKVIQIEWFYYNFRMQIRWDDLEPLEEMKDGYQPDMQEIIEYAKYLGCVLPEDKKYLSIAKQGLMASLPPFWQACEAPNGELYFRNKKTRQITAENPLDDIFRQKILQIKRIEGTYGVEPINEESALRQSSGVLQSNTRMKSSNFLKAQGRTTKNQEQPSQSIIQHHITEESIYSEEDQVIELQENSSKLREKQVSEWKKRQEEHLKWIKTQIDNFYPSQQQLITSYDTIPLDYQRLSQFMNIDHLKQLIQMKDRIAKKNADIQQIRRNRRQLQQAYRNLNKGSERFQSKA